MSRLGLWACHSIVWWCLWNLCQPICPAAAPAVWPTYRADVGRRGYSDSRIDGPLHLRWSYQTSQAPRPAWPAPARGSYWQQLPRLESRVVDDHAFHPVVSDQSVFLASSADDHVYCLSLETGACRWKFATDGPVRFAPCVGDGRVWFSSDDGVLYCLDAARGELLWKRDLAPGELRIPGNGRVISAWPARTGIVVDDGHVYATAGLFPHQGVWAFAVDAISGEVIWKTPLDFSAQGYLLTSSSLLFVPTGRSNPVALSQSDGSVRKRFDGVGGSYAVITEDALVAGRGNDGSLALSDLESRDQLATFPGQDLVVSPADIFLLGAKRLQAIDRVRYNRATREASRLEQQRSKLQAMLRSATPEQATDLREKLLAVVDRLDLAQQEQRASRRWQVEVPHDQAVVGCSSHLVLGGSNEIALYDVETGDAVWTAPVDGAALGLALAGKSLVVTTDRGWTYCFSTAPHEPAASLGPQREAPPSDERPHSGRPASPAPHTRWAERAVRQLASPRGIALVLGLTDGSLVEALAAHSVLHVVAVDEDEQLVQRIRKRLVAAGLYGDRAVVHHIPAGNLPFTDYIANVVMSESLAAEGELAWPRAEMWRVTRPFGGLMWLTPESEPARRGQLAGAGSWSQQYANGANTANSGDSLVTSRLQLQWFGGPGPARMVDRHLRGPAPLCAEGQLIVAGENCLIGVDAYNGTEQWHLDLPGSQRYTMPYDAGYMSLVNGQVYVAVNDACWQIDAHSGNHLDSFAAPAHSQATHWGYVLADQHGLFGTLQYPTASRTAPSRQQIDIDYNHNQPLVTSRAVFLLDAKSQRTKWTYEEGVIVNSTITIDDGQLFFVESRHQEAREDRTGRLPLPSLMASAAYVTALDAETGRLRWQVPVPAQLAKARSVLYLQCGRDLLVATGSYGSEDDDTRYCLAAWQRSDGSRVWTAEHAEQKPGEFAHGEQVHHPVLLGERLVAEPFIYDLQTGRRTGVDAGDTTWQLVRPGHSCGTLSGAGQCLFFRANNPAVLDLSEQLAADQRIQKLLRPAGPDVGSTSFRPAAWC